MRDHTEGYTLGQINKRPHRGIYPRSDQCETTPRDIPSVRPTRDHTEGYTIAQTNERLHRGIYPRPDQ
eukprot:7483229-Pyramimonas_sp.AAC.1